MSAQDKTACVSSDNIFTTILPTADNKVHSLNNEASAAFSFRPAYGSKPRFVLNKDDDELILEQPTPKPSKGGL